MTLANLSTAQPMLYLEKTLVPRLLTDEKTTNCVVAVKARYIQYCPKCENIWTECEEQTTPVRHREILMGLRSALRRWLTETNRKVTWVADEANITRRRLDWFLNEPSMTNGPGRDFYLRLLEVEERHPGYFDRLIVHLLRTLAEYHVERN